MQGSLRSQPPALALLEWWHAHSSACDVAYRGLRHADAAVASSVVALAEDAKLTVRWSIPHLLSVFALISE